MQLHAFDAPYLERLRQSDAETERHFVSYFGELLLIKLRSRLRSRTQIDDVRQETFLRVLRVVRSGTLHDAQRLGAFVNSVCNNVLLELHRSNGRHPNADEEGVLHLESEALGPEDELLSQESRREVRRILDGMSDRDRRVLQAVFLEERDKDEVVAQLGIDRNYLRVVLHRAKQQFRERYQAERPAPAARPFALRPPRAGGP